MFTSWQQRVQMNQRRFIYVQLCHLHCSPTTTINYRVTFDFLWLKKIDSLENNILTYHLSAGSKHSNQDSFKWLKIIWNNLIAKYQIQYQAKSLTVHTAVCGYVTCCIVINWQVNFSCLLLFSLSFKSVDHSFLINLIKNWWEKSESCSSHCYVFEFHSFLSTNNIFNFEQIKIHTAEAATRKCAKPTKWPVIHCISIDEGLLSTAVLIISVLFFFLFFFTRKKSFPV